MRQITLDKKCENLHKQYFKNNILNNISNEIKSENIKFIDEDLKGFIFDDGFFYSANKIQSEHKRFLKFCIKTWKIISVAKSDDLKRLINHIEKNYKLITNLLRENFKFSELNKKNLKGQKYSNVLVDLFGYNNFDKGDFIQIIKNKAKENVKLAKNKTENINYCYDVQKEMTNILVKLFPEIEIQIRNKLPEIKINSISNLQESNIINQDDFVEKVKELEIEYSLGLTLNNYKIVMIENIWNPYTFVLMSNLRTCPYCNRQYITPILTPSGKMRGDLDHFLPKSKYPYLSMSLYNLVPVCKFCNSSLKGDEEFTTNELNPYDGSFDDNAEFYAEFEDKKHIRIYIRERKNLKSANGFKNINKFLKTFKLELQYSYHNDQVLELIQKRLAYSEELIKDIKHNVFKDGLSEKRLKEILIGYTEDELKINDEPLSKFRKDIVKQLKFFDDSDTELMKKLKKIVES